MCMHVYLYGSSHSCYFLVHQVSDAELICYTVNALGLILVQLKNCFASNCAAGLISVLYQDCRSLSV